MIMAIYHLHVKVLSRSAGHSAIAAAAYRRAARMKDTSEGKTYNYDKKSEVEFSDIAIPADSPKWLKEIAEDGKGMDSKSSELLWTTVENFETRINSQLAREMEFSLPIELTTEQNIELAKSFIQQHIISRGMVADWSFHNKKDNPHVHVMMSTRLANELGFGEKVREWNSRSLVRELRKSWADTANAFLQMHGHEVSIDHRSYKDAGIDLIPQVHLGKVNKMNKRNIDTEIMSIYVDNNAKNLTIISENPQALITKINNQKQVFDNNDIADNLYKYSCSTSVDPALFALPSTNIEFLTKAKIAAIIEKIEYHDSVFTLDKVEKELKGLTSNYKQLARAIVEVKNAPNVLSLGFGDDGKERFTTANMLALERDIQVNVTKLQANVFTLLTEESINSALGDYELFTGKKLTEEQDRAVRHIVGKESISCIVGRAGTGKSFSLAAAKSVWDSQGNQVYGVALSGIAADGLVKDAGMDSRTIASFLLSVEAGSIKLSNNTVIVMDEAGMTDSFSMQKIVKLAEEAGSKLVLVGDPAQLQPVGPGASFRAILEKAGFAEIQTVYRQKEEWQRAATVEFSKSNTANGVQAYYDNGCVFMLNDSAAALDKLATDWQQIRNGSDKDISKYLVIAHRNADVQLLNNTLRDMRVSSGEIASGYSVKNEVAGQEREIKLSQGDRIVFLKNYKELGLANGRFATVTYVNFSESGKVIDFNVRLDGNGKEMTINPTSCNNFDYGYAATVHKTQGVTVDHSFVYGGGNLNSSLTYVAMTRHKETTGLYASLEQYKTISVLKERVSRLEVKDSVLNYLDQIDDFAGRRGLDTNQKTLKSIIVDSLVKARDRMIELVASRKIDVILDVPEHDNAQNMQEPVNQVITAQDQAKLVSKYVSVKRQLGQAYEALKPKLAMLGLDKISYEEKIFAVISQIPEYQDLQELNLQLQKLAYDIKSNLELSSQALELNRVDLDKLSGLAARHAIRERVAQYAEAVKNNVSLDTAGNAVDSSQARNKLAFEITRNIPSHYLALKEYLVDVAGVKADSLQYVFDLVASRKIEAKFTSFDSAVREYLELEIKCASIDKQIRAAGANSDISVLVAQKASRRAELASYVKQFEDKFGQELKQHGGQDKAITIGTSGGFSEVYSRCLDGKLTVNDLSAISRMVAYHQISELVIARSAYIVANNASKPVFEECKANGVSYVQTPEFAAALKTRIAYAAAINKVTGDFNEIARALEVYNIKSTELERYTTGISHDYGLKAVMDYVAIDKSDLRQVYEASFNLSMQQNAYAAAKSFDVDFKEVQQNAKELLTAYVLDKHGLWELAKQSPAAEYIDIVVTSRNKIDSVYVAEEQDLQADLVAYAEARIVRDKLFHEVRIRDNKQFENEYKLATATVENIKARITTNPAIQNTISAKYDDKEFNFRNVPELKGGIHQAYQRVLQGKLSSEDYAALSRETTNKIVQQQAISRSMKR